MAFRETGFPGSHPMPVDRVTVAVRRPRLIRKLFLSFSWFALSSPMRTRNPMIQTRLDGKRACVPRQEVLRSVSCDFARILKGHVRNESPGPITTSTIYDETEDSGFCMNVMAGYPECSFRGRRCCCRGGWRT